MLEMSPSVPFQPSSDRISAGISRLAVTLGNLFREERLRRRWSLRQLASKAGHSPAAVHRVESGRPASVATYVRLQEALGLRLEIAFVDPRRRQPLAGREIDLVHSAMGEQQADRLRALGYSVGVDEPYQHYQFAGRADVVAWDLAARALLHIENRTRFPDLQQASGAWNAKRSYPASELAARLGVGRWASVTHTMAVLWSAEALHVLRTRQATFRSLCPDAADAFRAWWSTGAPASGITSSLVVFDPCASRRQRLFVDLDEALAIKPRHRDYADLAHRLRSG
jgi:transcriptional regulator with XRE-family HTH domain